MKGDGPEVRGHCQECIILHPLEECPARPSTVRFARYERIDEPGHCWLADPKNPLTPEQEVANHRHNDTIDALRYALYQQVERQTEFLKMFPFPPDQRPWHQRAWSRVCWWVDAHWPRVHLGPCDHSDCENY